ncbi:elongator complex protein 1 [Anticarsia gemmatalis]|uniref:elongator complex protein 1 n=1 Tax=Anticarsia gemmatalis TaxID=129554 RepID=UPI003F763D1D
MKNLNLWVVSVNDLKLKLEDKLTVCSGCDDEGSSNELFVCTHNLCVINYNENGDTKWTKDLSEFASPDNRPVNITFLTLTNALCVGLANGELITISDGGNTYDLAGTCDNGLLAMEWSPDQELLVLVTKDMNMILMNMFDPINEGNLLNEDFGEKQFITVGWGKKETQFHGSAGKQARVKSEVTADETLSDSTVKISWRGDGNLYAIGFTMDGIRRFKVFDKEGNLQYTSEKQQGLESNLSWRPSGNLIATTQKLNEKYIVSFFEKNGLKHGEFDIPVNSNTIVEDITWSSDSEVLTLQCRDMTTNTQLILLYTIGNYHWYLKQTLEFSNEQRISKIMWDNDFDIINNKKLHVFLHNGQHLSYTWIWNVDHSRGIGDNDDAVVAVIDGKKVLLTGFRQTVVPPPMCSFEVNLDANVTSIHFAPRATDTNPNSFFVCTADNKLVFYKHTNKFPLQYELYKTVDIPQLEFPFQNYNWFWVNHDTVVSVAVEGGYDLVEYTIGADKIEKKRSSYVPAGVTKIQPHPTETSSVFLQLQSKSIVLYELGKDIDISQDSQIMAPFDVICQKFNVFAVENELQFIGLSHKGQLYINDKMTMNNVSSYYVHSHFLLVTTLQHVLLCAELTNAGIEAISEYQKTESDHVYKRKIERGAKLVIAVPNDTRTVFQLPRGNLETIQPRPLSLKIIGEFLDKLQYHEAFDLMRKQRINLNLIYDHDPNKFVENIDTFLESVKNNSWLNLFLSDLENLDVTKTMYASSYASKDKATNGVDTKIQKICDIVREHLKKRSDSDSKVLPLLTTFVKKNTVEDMEKALLIIKELKVQESGGSKLPVGSDEALKYLLYMVDVNNLFDVALGMYDFDLVLLVANKSQKDPKEYVPMLDELNEMEENYKRFTINKHLKRFDRAVESLVLCGTSRHNELKTFVKYHSLYREALALFSPSDEIFKEISDDFGLYLKLKKQYTEAGVIYERASNIEKAIECYKDALEWELAISLAISWPEDQFKSLCWDLVEGLKEEKRHKEALIILEQYYGKGEEAVSYAVECGQYKTALRLCSQHKLSHLKEAKVLLNLLEEYNNIKEQIETSWANFIRHRDRLQFVRVNKTKHPVDTYDFYTNKDSDLYSDAGSTIASSSRGSTRSFRSSKNRRKHERKVASLKEGSQYEDVALVMALHTLVVATFDLRLLVKEVIIALSYFSKDKEAFLLQSSLEKVLKDMKDSFKDIWTNELVLEATNASIAALNVPEGQSIVPQGIATLEPHIRIAPVISDISWKLDGLN